MLGEEVEHLKKLLLRWTSQTHPKRLLMFLLRKRGDKKLENSKRVEGPAYNSLSLLLSSMRDLSSMCRPSKKKVTSIEETKSWWLVKAFDIFIVGYGDRLYEIRHMYFNAFDFKRYQINNVFFLVISDNFNMSISKIKKYYSYSPLH
jgi:hypothetical protein